MKHIFSSKRLQSLIALSIALLVSCHKDPGSINQQNLPQNNLGFLSENIIKINQEVIVYDSTRIKDSLDFAIPPSDRYYEWKVIPENQCDSAIGDNNLPIAKFIFHCPGTYFLTAKIYDSPSHNLVGTTDTIAVQVATETLRPVQAIGKDDKLDIRAGVANSWSDPHTPENSPPDESYINLIFTTENEYEDVFPGTSLDYTSEINANNYSFLFSDSLRLLSYPISRGYGLKNKVNTYIELRGLSFGLPANLTITWLGKTYTGTITLISQHAYSVVWDNTGAVTIH